MTPKEVFKRRSKIIMSIANSQEKIAAQELLALTVDELRNLAGEVLQPESARFRLDIDSTYSDGETLYFIGCKTCKKNIGYHAEGLDLGDYEATVGCGCKPADPIALTLDNAYKWKKWADEKFNKLTCLDALEMVYREVVHPEVFSTSDILYWFLFESKPKHSIIFAMLCRIKSENVK